jgi:uncharacterized protein (TIGR02588 family)
MGTKKDKKAASDKVEWIIAAAGMVLVTAALTTIVYRAITQEVRPPEISVSVESVSRSDRGFRVDFLVLNTGTQTASSVQIEGQLRSNGEIVESSTVTLAYAPSNSQRRGGMNFSRDPNEHELTIRAAGFEKP